MPPDLILRRIKSYEYETWNSNTTTGVKLIFIFFLNRKYQLGVQGAGTWFSGDEGGGVPGSLGDATFRKVEKGPKFQCRLQSLCIFVNHFNCNPDQQSRVLHQWSVCDPNVKTSKPFVKQTSVLHGLLQKSSSVLSLLWNPTCILIPVNGISGLYVGVFVWTRINYSLDIWELSPTLTDFFFSSYFGLVILFNTYMFTAFFCYLKYSRRGLIFGSIVYLFGSHKMRFQCLY